MAGSNRETLTGGSAIVKSLLRHDVDTVFGLPGVQTYPIFDALHVHQNAIRTITPRHEQGAAYMAMGYAQVTGKPGVFSVVPGPGILNTGAALNTAWASSSPILGLTGQVPSSYLGLGHGHLHEMPDQLATLRSFVKWADRIDHAGDAPGLVDEAFLRMQTGRKGPVTLEMCWDRLAEPDEVAWPMRRAVPDAADPDPDTIAAAAERAAKAHAPMIMVGSGAKHAAAEVLELARLLNAPVLSVRGGRGVVPADDPLSVGPAEAFYLWKHTDLLIGIGSRCELPYMRWSNNMAPARHRPAPPDLIRIDIDPVEMHRLQPDIGVLGDSRRVTSLITEAVSRHPGKVGGDSDRIAVARSKGRALVETIKPHVEHLETIRDVLPRDGIFVEEVCQAGFVSFFSFPIYSPRTYVTCGFSGTLGFGFPTALGAKAAFPDRPVISITGDGGFLFGVQELATAAQFGIGLTTILFNNSAFGNVRRDQAALFDGRVIGSDLENPNFEKMCDSFGVGYRRAVTNEDLKRELEASLAANRPEVIEVPVDPATEVPPWRVLIPERFGISPD
ncbi:MAG: thiamine pyrophosphate-dependent enzyme [Pseudomonadota bacterium]